jgi:hypothetical protein
MGVPTFYTRGGFEVDFSQGSAELVSGPDATAWWLCVARTDRLVWALCFHSVEQRTCFATSKIFVIKEYQ